jgi:hypothetical protein
MVALAGSRVFWTYFGGPFKSLNLRRSCQDPLKGRDFFLLRNWRATMPKVARISPSVSRTSSSSNSDSAQFISVALFSGIGLLISLVAVLAGIKGYWF